MEFSLDLLEFLVFRGVDSVRLLGVFFFCPVGLLLLLLLDLVLDFAGVAGSVVKSTVVATTALGAGSGVGLGVALCADGEGGGVRWALPETAAWSDEVSGIINL